MNELISMKEFKKWMENRVTREYLELIQIHRDAMDKLLTNSIKYANKLKDLDLNELDQYRGQMFAMDLVLDTELFLSEKLEQENEVIDDVQVQTSTRLLSD